MLFFATKKAASRAFPRAAAYDAANADAASTNADASYAAYAAEKTKTLR